MSSIDTANLLMTEIDGILKLNPQQKDGAKHKGNTIVSAGAGCGKTKTMIGRIVYKILEGVPLSQMLIITFTRAAAASIKQKMSETFSKILASKTLKGYPESERIREAAYAMPVSEIGTIHSFCQRLIRTYFYEAKIDPARTICDDSEAGILKSAAVKSAVKEAKNEWARLRNEVKNGASVDERKLDMLNKFIELCDMMSDRRTDNGVEKILLKIIDYALSVPGSDGFFEKIKKDGEILPEFLKEIENMRAALISRVEDMYNSVMSEGFNTLLRARELKDYFELAPGAVKPSLPKWNQKPKDPAKLTAYNLLKEEFRALRDDCEAYVDYRQKIEAAAKNDYEPYARAIMAVARDALARYDRRKEDRGVIDYADLEHGAIKILSNEGCVKEITSRIKYVFIDEYQDVNPLQNSIAEKFRESGAEVFLVGDIKQSIYGFRRCDPKYFSDALEPESPYHPFYLNDNYRSSPEVVSFVNGVFGEIMTEECGMVTYDKNQALVAKAHIKGGAEFVYIDKDAKVKITSASADTACRETSVDTVSSSKTPGETGAALAEKGEAKAKNVAEKSKSEDKKAEPYSVVDAAEKASCRLDPEACYIAKRILELTDPDGEYKARYGEITVLLRSMSSFAATLFETLGRFGIPVSIERSESIKEFPEAVALLDIARCVDTALDDVALYTALRSSMGGFNDEELAEIALCGASLITKGKPSDCREPFVKKVRAYKGKHEERLREFFALREKFRKYSECHDAADTLGYITSEIDYFTHVYTVCGPHAASAVEALITCAADKKCDLHTFIEHCSSQGFELSASSVGDTVQITTIHKSKGLEYKYCFVAECSKKFNTQDLNEKVIIDKDGLSLKVPCEGGLIGETVPYISSRQDAEKNIYSEEMRTLYVALTRAEKMLIVTGKTHKTNKSYSTFLESVPFLSGIIADPLTEIVVTEREPENFENDDITNEVELRRRRALEYPSKNIPIKTSVTFVAESSDDDNVADKIADDGDRGGAGIVRRRTFKPKAGEEDGLTKGERARLSGTAYHAAMELIDFANPDFEKIKGEIENAELITEEGEKQIIKAAEEMRALTEGARFVCREQRFIAELPVEKYGGERVLVQGIIDLLIIDKNGKIIIVDYKTTTEEGLDWDGYKIQLGLYADAVKESIGRDNDLGVDVDNVELYLYSFAHGFRRIEYRAPRVNEAPSAAEA